MINPFYSGKYIRVESLENGVKKLILSRPDVKNAFHSEMIDEISKALIALAKVPNEKDMRLLIIEGEGNIFSSGADLNYMKEQSKKTETQNLNDARQLGRMFYKLASFPTPVLCAVRGAAIGGALGLTVCADYVICDEKAVFMTSEVLLGIIPGVISPYIIRKIGVSRSSYFMLSGKKMDAQEAHNIGLVNQVVTDSNYNNELNKVIKQFLMAGPKAARKTKELIQNCSPLPSQELFEFCAEQIALARSTDEANLGLNSFFEKQTPEWCK
jgi:methylglutaconyl-CoA hydratase